MTGKSLRKPGPKGQKRADHLMEVAIDLFSERGYGAVTIQDITQRAGVAHSLVYYHFKNKEELFNKAVNNLIDKQIRQYQASLQQHTDPIELIEKWIQYNIDHSAVLMKLVRIMFDRSGSQNATPFARDAIRHFYNEEHNILSRSVAQGIRQKQFRQVEPDSVASFVSTHIDGVFYGACTQENFDIRLEMERMRSILWKILCDPEETRLR